MARFASYFKSIYKVLNSHRRWVALGIIAALIISSAGFVVFRGYHWLTASRSFETRNDENPEPVINVDQALKDFGLRIETIGVLAPVIKNVDGAQKAIYSKKLNSGTAHYKDTALPGAGSNIFIFGHSSSAIGTGPYATIFAKLNDLKKGDEVIISYQDKEYRYKIASKKVIEKTETSVLDPTPTEQLTLMTCWPIGTADKRLIVIAKPI